MTRSGGSSSGRGIFLVLEGIDRSGKTQQLGRVSQFLESRGFRVMPLCYPDRCTQIGAIIKDYLTGKLQAPAECIHLLFSANRWEQQHMLRRFLDSGVTVVCDRYCYSGYAYSVGAAGLEREWARMSDRGLIEPDLVFQLDVPPETAAKRQQFGEEIYEQLEVQQRVREAFEDFHQDKNWVLVPHDDDVETVTAFIADFLLTWLRSRPVKNGKLEEPLHYSV